MHTNGSIGGAGPTGDEADAWLAGEFAIGFRHIGRPALLPANDELDRTLGIVEGVKRREVALAGHAEDAFHTVDPEGVDKDQATASLL